MWMLTAFSSLWLERKTHGSQPQRIQATVFSCVDYGSMMVQTILNPGA